MAPDDTASRLPQDEALRARALKVIPGGMWGHMNVASAASRLSAVFS